MSEWRFLLDENIDPKVATYLDKEGLFAAHVRDAVGQGADDEGDSSPTPANATSSSSRVT
jgi:predicted nuclease of predicted toxin-antitoxin system